MASIQNRNDVNRVEWFELFGRLGVTVISYPLEYVKVLIQIGHEPIPPKPTRTLLGRPALALPGVFTYMKHIRTVDGFTGLYRGLTPRLCSNLLSGFTYRIVIERLPNFIPEELLEKPEVDLTNDQKITIFVHGLIKETAARSIQIIASHPFHIVTVRVMAQFIGREENYGGIFGSLREIFDHDGILGFFSGLVPRMVGDIFVLWIGASTAFFINTFLVEEEALKSYVRSSMANDNHHNLLQNLSLKRFLSYLASALFYPFAVVSNVAIVNNCGLQAGRPPNMPIYTDWRDCWSHLSAIGQLKRGSSILWRYYTGPYINSAALSGSGSGRAYAQSIIPSFKY